MSELELIGPVAPSRPRPGQVAELYRRGDEYFWVSTVPNIAATDLGPTEQSFMSLGGMFGQAMTGEETMAFPADPEGNVLDWSEVAVANGPGSRERVLEALRHVGPEWDRSES